MDGLSPALGRAAAAAAAATLAVCMDAYSCLSSSVESPLVVSRWGHDQPYQPVPGEKYSVVLVVEYDMQSVNGQDCCCVLRDDVHVDDKQKWEANTREARKLRRKQLALLLK